MRQSGALRNEKGKRDEKSESITQVLEFDKRDAHKGLKGINQISKQINKLDIDCTIAPHRSFRTSLLASKIKLLQP